MRRRWVVMRCWAGVASTMAPTPTRLRYWTRRGAENTAGRWNCKPGWPPGTWFEIARLDGGARG